MLHDIKNSQLKAVTLGLLLFALLTPAVSAQSPKAISIVAPKFWCPFACDANSPQHGFAIEIARAAFLEFGITVNYTNMPYDRALLEVKKGVMVQAVVPTFKEEAPHFIYPNNATSATEYCFYVKENSGWHFTDYSTLNKIRFAATSGYIYSPKMDAYIAQHANKTNGVVYLLKGEDVPTRMFKMIIKGRYDAFLEDTRLIDFLRSSGKLAGLKKAGCLDIINYGYLALTPSATFPSRQMAKYFDEGLLILRKSGKLKEILDKYGVQDWQ